MTGFIGSHLCRALSELGAEVVGVSRSEPTFQTPDGCQWQQLDLTELSRVRKLVQRVDPDLVYHLAGCVSSDAALSQVLPTINNCLIGSAHLFLTLAEQGKRRRVIVAGSSEEANESGLHPGSPYGTAKAATALYAQMFHQLYGLPIVWARVFTAYGPRQPQSKLIPYVIQRLLSGQSPKVTSGNRLCDFIYIEDVVNGLIRCALDPATDGSTVELGTGHGTTIRQMVEILVDLCGGSLGAEFSVVSNRPAESSHVARSESQNAIGWRARWPLPVGLAETVAWYKSGLEKS